MTITALILLPLSLSGFQAPGETGRETTCRLRGEYREDTLDYEEEKKRYFREKGSLKFSTSSSLNLTHVYIEQDQHHQYTWNLMLKDISPCFSLLLGNYYVHFGAGLLAGRKNPYIPDIFNIMNDYAPRFDSFTPCNSGNPRFSFHGIALSIIGKTENIQLSLNPFYSAKTRYFDDTRDENSISLNLTTVEQYDKKDGARTEPLSVIDYGVSVNLRFYRCLAFQIYHISSELRTPLQETINWNREENDEGIRETSAIRGYGMYVEYRDDYLRLFAEKSLSEEIIEQNDTTRLKKTGHAILIGASLNHPFIRASFSGKSSDTDYYSPHERTLGSWHPETGIFGECHIKPVRGLVIGSLYSSQRQKVPGQYDRERPVTTRERIYTRLTAGILKVMELMGNRVTCAQKGDHEKRHQVKGRFELLFEKRLNLGASFIRQYRNGTAPAGMYSLQAGIHPFSGIGLKGAYAVISSSADNTLYAVLLPLQKSNVPGIQTRDNCHALVGSFNLTFGTLQGSFRYLYLKYATTGEKQTRIELFSQGEF